jgi:nucleotide-binding universal stress UspA family protein
MALRYAARIAARTDAPVTALVVNDPLLTSAAAAASRDPGMLTATTFDELRRFVTRTLGSAGAAVALKVVVGDPGQQIDRFARRLGGDLIVMGTHGLSGPRKWFFGSVTETVLRRATIPVLAVPATVRAASGLRDFPGGPMLLPIDLDGNERAEARAALQAANRLGMAAVLLHVVEPLHLPPWIGMDIAELDQQRIRGAQKRLRNLASSLSSRVPSRVVAGEPSEQIAGAAVKEKAGVIALTLKRGGLFRPRQGSLTYRVLCQSVAPVLALPEPRR